MSEKLTERDRVLAEGVAAAAKTAYWPREDTPAMRAAADRMAKALSTGGTTAGQRSK